MRHLIYLALPLLWLLLGMGSAVAAPPQTATLAVEKMTCGTCPVVVKKALTRVPGVTNTNINIDKKTATVVFDLDKTTIAQLTQATAEAGFPSRLIAHP